MKRKLALVLSAAMIASCLPAVGYAAAFTDSAQLPRWAAPTINRVADLGLIKGYEDGTFRAENNVTYCEAMVMVYNVLLKAGSEKPLSAAEEARFHTVMDNMQIPGWAKTPVAYGLAKNIIAPADLAKFVTNGRSNPAPREEVAKLFGNALSSRYEVDNTSKEASKFRDFWDISTGAMVQVDLLKRLGILSGDDTGNFHPKADITRAEMAIMLNKTHDVLQKGVSVGTEGTVLDIRSNGSNYFIEIRANDGKELGFHASDSTVKVIDNTTGKTISLSRLSKGDKISFERKGDTLLSIRLLSGTSAQEKYDVTGYIVSMKGSTLNLENENTGAEDEYILKSNTKFYLDNKSIRERDLKDALEDNDDRHAYAGLNVEVKEERVDGERQDVYYVKEIFVSFTDEYTETGRLNSLSDKSVSFKQAGSGINKSYSFASGCTYYIGSKKSSLKELQKMADRGTTYVKVTVDNKNKAKKIALAEDSFDSETGKPQAQKETIYEVLDLSEARMTVEAGGRKTTYSFGSANPLKNIKFYTWDAAEEDFTDVIPNAAERYFDKNDTVYCRIDFNKGGRISAVYLADKKSAWKQDETMTERKGTVAYVKNGKLKFETSNTEYTLMSQYNIDYDSEKDGTSVTGPDANGSTVKYPLVIESAVTSSKTVFERMANSSDVELYAEIEADSQNRAVKIKARLKEAEGTLVEYDNGADSFISILTADGGKLNLKTTSKPKLGDEDSYTLDDLTTQRFVGAKLKLEFNSSGLVNKIIVTETPDQVGAKWVKGTAVSADNGLKVEGDSKTYAWVGRTIDISNRSMDSVSLDKLKTLIEDRDTEEYVEARLDEKDRVEAIRVYVKQAEGALQEYNSRTNTLRIKTDAGNLFTFNVVSKPKCSVRGLTLDKLNDYGKDRTVRLTFNKDGYISEIR